MTKVIKGVTYCDRPDRHDPRLKCGYPMPCPHHTGIIRADRAIENMMKKFGKKRRV